MNIPNLGARPVILDKRKPKITLEFQADMGGLGAKFEGFPTPMTITVAHMLPTGEIVLVIEPKLASAPPVQVPS